MNPAPAAAARPAAAEGRARAAAPSDVSLFESTVATTAAAALAGLGLLLGTVVARSGGSHALATWLHQFGMLAGAIPALPQAVRSLRRARLDVHVLMLAAAGGTLILDRPGEGAALLFLFALSAALEAFAMGRTRSAIKALLKLRPATIRRPDGTVVPVEEARPGEVFVVHPGESFALDGVVTEGISTVDAASMTGESEPVPCAPGDRVVSGTLNLEGRLTVRATSTVGDSALEKVIQLVAAAQEQKSLATAERFADLAGRVWAPGVLAAALLWYLYLRFGAGTPNAQALYPALTLLVAGSPCALVLSSPAAVLSALASAGRRGLLIRSGAVLETLAEIDTIALDKTGTLTTGQPTVVSTWASLPGSEPEMLRAAAALEKPLSHPLARAVVRAAAQQDPIPDAVDHRSLAGLGVTGRVAGRDVRVGRPEWVAEGLPRDAALALAEAVAGARAEGRSVVAVRDGDHLVGVLGLADTLREDTPAALAALNALGVRPLLLTGDHRQAAARLETALTPAGGPSPFAAVHADLKPEDKATIIRGLADGGARVAMVGDGVNDAPALATARTGIALGGIGSDVALETADVVVMEDRLSRLPLAFSLARRARVVVRQNVILSVSGVVLLSLAVLLLRGAVPLPVAVLAHEGTTVLVVLNGLRLLRA